MPLGTLDRAPPPLFRQGWSALTKLAFFAALALFLMVADARFAIVQPLRATLATLLHPVQRSLLVPVEAWAHGAEYVAGFELARENEADARRRLADQSEQTSRLGQLEQENVRLRNLLDLRQRMTVNAHAAEVLYEASDPYSRKVIIDRGQREGVIAGSPVINEDGVLGQVTRVYPLSAEVTLLTDKDAAIPLLNSRTQQRSIAYGLAGGAGLELRFMASNADVQEGDLLTTSGVDAVYPPGVPVARVSRIDRRNEAGFATITLSLLAKPDGVRQVLVLDPIGAQMPPRELVAPPPPPPSAPARKGSRP